MKKVLFSLVAMLLLSVSGIAQTTYTLVNSASDLEAGKNYLLVGYDNDGNAFAMSLQKSNNRHAVAVEEIGGTITATLAETTADSLTFEFTLGGTTDAWTIYDPLNDGYLCAPGGGNKLTTQSALDDKGCWTITDGEEGGMFPVSNGGVEQCYMRYNISSKLFSCYKQSTSVAAPVYFFKGGSGVIPDPDPEPSNYPTDFHCLTNEDGTSITLDWADATGGQLPDKYLVLASTGDITVPTDGTPVEDGELAKNVAYGVQTVTFSGLQGNTTYHFAIFPYTNGGSNINYKTDGNYPTTLGTTEQIFTLLFEDFDEELGAFTAFNIEGEQVWHHGSYQGTTYANMNGGFSGGANLNEDWLVSPKVSSGDYQDALLEFRTAVKFNGDPLRVKISVDYDGQSDPTSFEWIDITDKFVFSTGNYEWVESGTANIYSIIDGYELGYPDFYVAFVYTCNTEAGASWEIDYVKVVSFGAVSVAEQNLPIVSLYPNPASEQVSFVLENDAQVSVFDMTGRKVRALNLAAGNAQIDVNELEDGVYFVNFRYANGSMTVSKFVKF